MYDYNTRLDTHALMTPHIMVWRCRNCRDIPRNCKSIGGVIYCIPPIPDSGVSGSEALSMGVEELCIYEKYKDNNNAQLWWQYMINLYSCSKHDYSASCRMQVKRKVGIDVPAIEKCKAKESDIIFNEFILWQTVGIPYSPAVVINNKVYRVIQTVIFREA